MSGNIHRPHRKGRQLHANESQPRLARRTEEPADAGVEESLREAELRFRTIFDNTSDGIFLHDLETGKLMTCNRSCSRMLGYAEEEFTQLSVADIHPEADLPFIHAQIGEFLKGGKPIRCDIRFRRKDGSILFADVSPDLVLLDGRRYVLVVLKDITERKRAEESLAESERKYRSLVENIPDVTWTTDSQGHTLFISPNVREVYGYSANEVCAAGSAWLENVHPDDRERIERAFDELFTQKKRYDVEYRIRRRDGTWIWLHDRSVSTYEKDGQWYADGIFSDITQRKRMEEELQRHTEHLEELVAARTGDLWESEQRLKHAQEIAHLGSWELDLTNGHLSWSDEVYRIFGLQPQEFAASYEAFLAHVHPDDRDAVDAAYIGSLREGRDTYEIEHRIVRRSTGEIRFVHEKCEHVRDASGRIIRSLGMVHDITDRKRMEESLRFTQFAVDHMADAAFWMTDDARIFYVNEAACQALGYSRDELLRMTIYDIDPAFTKSMWSTTWPALKAKKSIVFETVHQARDGTIHPVEIRANYLEFGGREYDCAFARDITTRKRAQAALEESEQRYRRLVENLKGSHFVYRHDPEGVLTYVSESVTQVLGYTPDEGMPHYGKYFTDHPANQAARRHTELTLQGIRQPSYEVSVWHKDGSTRWLEVQEVPVYDADGKVVAVEGVAQDVTERKRAEEALLEKDYLLSESQRIGRIGSWSADLATYAVTWTSETYRLFGVSPDTFVPSADTMIDLLHPDDRDAMREWIRAALAGEHPGVLEVRVILPDGFIHVLSGRGELVFADGHKPVRLVGTVQDVTTQKEAQNAMRTLNEQLEVQVVRRTEELRHTVDRLRQLTLELSQAEDRERKRIADILHEDVQQILAAARFHLNLLSSGTYSAEESKEIIEQVKQMLRDAIERSRNLSHELSPAMYQVELIEILEWLARHMRQRHGLTVHVEARGRVDSPSEPLKAFLYKVTQELLFNVVKHAGVREARVRVRRMRNWICLSVLDQGCGFDSRELERAAGFGLLSIRERVRLLGGRMKIRSTSGVGSRLAIAVPDPGTSGEAAPAEEGAGPARPETPGPEDCAEES